MSDKIVINNYDDFRRLEGQQIVNSDPVEITADGIQDFCRGTYNDEWIHWDREKCQDSPLGDLIAPGLYLPALFPYMFWQVMEINIPRMIVKGIDRIRILKPVTIGSKIVGKATVDKVLDRDNGIEVHYAIAFEFADSGDTAAVCTFINRYWE
jgi:acyl dehydratase